MAKSAIAFLEGLNSSASTGVRSFGQGLMQAHKMRMEKSVAQREARRLDIAEAEEERRAAVFDPEAVREMQDIELGQARLGLEESQAAVGGRQAMEQAVQELGDLLMEKGPEAQLSESEVAEVAMRHGVSPADMEKFLGEAMEQDPQLFQAGPGTMYGAIEEGTFMPQGQVPFAPRAAGGGAAGPEMFGGMSPQMINALVNLGEYAEGGKPMDPMQQLMMAAMSMSPGAAENPMLQKLFSEQDQQRGQAKPELLGMVQGELQNIFTPVLQYDIDEESGEGILFNPATGDTLFGGR